IHSNKPSLFPFCDEINFDSRSQEDYLDLELPLPCVLKHLKFVKIEGLRGSVNELKFIEILLKSSMVLEKVVLFSYSIKKDPPAERRMLKLHEILLTFPKASTCTIILDPSR
ncbi:hypothetical protein MKW94_017128, partial [Papaver nudicaule]|nr:hypothetical protein [Papaver nudicaule]